MIPQKIESAPIETPVLTNFGVAIQWDGGDWFLCDINGDHVYDRHYDIMQIWPTKWAQLPDWMKP